jgi:outer membrane protein assembly complex protein YaeT
MRQAAITVEVAVLLLGPLMLFAQEKQSLESSVFPNRVRPATMDRHAARLPTRQELASAPIINDIEFLGLRRIARQALEPKISSRVEDELDADRIERDVRALAKLGCFESVRVEVEDLATSPIDGGQRVGLLFYTPELPFLTAVEYEGSRLLSRQQIEKLLGDKKSVPKLGEPENRVTLHRAAREIEAALQESGHLEAHVSIQEKISVNNTASVRFAVSDGPHKTVERVAFTGHPEISEKLLRHAMRRVTPGAFFNGLRGRNTYTREGFEEDREHLLTYYRNHGYPEARVGSAQISQKEKASRHWLPWPRKRPTVRLVLSIPIEAGGFYKIEKVQTSAGLQKMDPKGKNRAVNYASLAGQPYSAEAVENLRRSYQSQLRAQAKRDTSASLLNVEVLPLPDPATHTVRIQVQPSSTAPYIVRHLEFTGTRRFSDRYLRRRVPLREGLPLDDRAIELGLAHLARTGYFKPIQKEDVRVETNELAHTADVTIHVQELGQQRASFIGGRGQFGNTVGVAYTLFNLFHGEELLCSKIEGGPESLQLALGLAKEGVFGSRGSLAWSVFNIFLRPVLTSPVKGPFFRQQTVGINADWSFALTQTDSFDVDYGLSRSTTTYSLALPPMDVQTKTSSHWAGAAWTRDTGNERIALADSVSGGWLGGSENLLRSKAEYGHIFHDDLFDGQNAWAFRTTASGVGSYFGDMPSTSRWFSGDEFVRGLRPGELGPYSALSSILPSRATHYSPAPAGANLIGAANAEYRVRLGSGVEAAGFFDVGSGWLLPNWLGKARPSLIDSTNGILHGSTGIELRGTVPGVGVPLRSYYALNLLRVHRSLLLPDGSLFRAQNRLFGFGWGLGTLF